jgi:1-acyl-sn-glycerol-3-phosphate acyltransferase
MPFPPRVARAITSVLGGAQVRDRAERLSFSDAGHGYDQFGMHPDFVAMGESLMSWLYDHYFRVKSYNSERIPRKGSAVIAANHSGTLPLDGTMLWLDILRHTEPPRAARPVADYFVSTLPVVSTLFARCGAVGGSRGNARALLQAGDLLLIFPEGTGGIGKPFRDRYKLQDWRQGHCELAIRYSSPVVPVAIIGAEEQMPMIGRLPPPPGTKIPYIPVPATLLPLPVRYHIHYGHPLRFDQEYSPADADNPEIVHQAAARVRAEVEALIDHGLRVREGVFR